MREWLPDTFEPPRMDERISSAISVVRVRNARRTRTVRAAKWATGAAVVLAVAFFFAPKPNRHEVGPQQLATKAPANASASATESRGVEAPETNGVPSTGAESTSPHLPIPSSPHLPSPDVSLAKAKGGVELKWQGNPNQDYIVYRCTTPRFDKCDVAGVVKGTHWTDREADKTPVVFYKIEPRG